MFVRHDATSIFLYLHHPVKGARPKGWRDGCLGIRRPFASEVESRAMITDFRLFAWVVLAAFSAALFRAAIPNH